MFGVAEFIVWVMDWTAAYFTFPTKPYISAAHKPAKYFWQLSRFELLAPLRITGIGYVPQGFITDGATVPLLARMLLQPTGKMMEPTAFHDHDIQLYSPTRWRFRSDWMFFRLCIHYDVNVIIAILAYLFVLIFGVFKVLAERLKKALNYK